MPYLLCGIETQDLLAEFNTITGSPTVNTTTKHAPGNASMRCNVSAATAFGRNASNNSTRGSFWIYVHSRPASAIDILGASGTTETIRLNASGYLELWSGASPSLQATGSHQIALDTWTRISWATSSSSFRDKIFVDGALDIDHTDALYLWGYFQQRIGVCQSATCDIYFDDIYFEDTGIMTNVDPGDVRVLVSQPYAAGDLTEYTASAGSNWDCVEEIPISISDFVRKGGSGTFADLYKIKPCGSISGTTSGTVCALEIIYNARRGGTSSGNIAYKDQGSMGRISTALTTSTAWYRGAWGGTAPNGGWWTWDKVGSLQIGALHNTGTHQVYGVYAVVAYIQPAAAAPPAQWYGQNFGGVI